MPEPTNQPTTAPKLNIDIEGIFSGSSGGVAPTQEQVSQINQKISGFTNPALAVSEIQKFAKDFAKPSDVPSVGRNDIVSNTDAIRDEELSTKGNAQKIIDSIKGFEDIDATSTNLLNEFTESKPYIQTDQGKQAFDELLNMKKSLGQFTDQELQQIEEAGQDVAAQFDILISDAISKKLKGEAKSTVGAGEVGGFLNTQFSGVAAIAPTEGGDFFGKGGELEYIRGTYDRNIDALKAQKVSAVNQAKAAARQALLTGKSADLTAALNLFNTAQSAHNAAITLAQDKITTISNLQTTRLNRVSQMFDLLEKVPEGESVTIDGVEYQGLKPGEVIDPFFSSSDIVSLMKALPTGESKTLTDPNTGDVWTIEGIGQKDNQNEIYRATNQNTGDETFTTINKLTGDIVKQVVSKGTGERYKYTAGGGTSSTVSLSKADREKLLTQFSGAEIDNIDKQVPVQGLQAFIDANDIAPEKAALLYDVYGGDAGQQDRVAVQSDIAAILGSDGYVDTAKYRQIRNNVASNSPDLLEWFNKTYPPKTYINPNDSSGADLRGEKPGSSGSSLDAALQSMKDQGFSRKDIEGQAKNQYGYLPDAVKNWLNENF